MPEKLQPLGKPNFSNLTPAQMRVSTVIEVGANYKGLVPSLRKDDGGCESCVKCEGCQSCQKCEGCQSCQKSLMATLGEQLGIAGLAGKPLKVAYDVIYERVQEADAEHGEANLTQSRVIVEMPDETYQAVPSKENFTVLGTTKAGVKQYLWQGSTPSSGN